jgi:hypothetical protein
MGYYWVTWRGRAAATVLANTADAAKEIAKAEGEVLDARQLPYPRHPQLNPEENGCPAFCYGRSECLDKTACPQRSACSE